MGKDALGDEILAICKKHNILLVVDNCFATPVLQRPIEFGADIVIHSATKYIDGQGRTLGGVILASEKIVSELKAFARHSGPALSPFNAWVLSKSLETLYLRVRQHTFNATEIAKRLEGDKRIKLVRYPYLPSCF